MNNNYTVLDRGLNVLGILSLENNSGNTTFWGDTITQQIADDGQNDDPTTLLSQTMNSIDSTANHKLWNHTLSINFEETDTIGKPFDSGYYLLYQDDSNNKNYLMNMYDVTEDGSETTKFKTANGNNSAIYDASHAMIVGKTFTNVNLSTIVKYIADYIGWSFIVNSDDSIKLDSYTIDDNATVMAVIQDLIIKFDTEVDAYVTLNGGRIQKRIIEFGELGEDNGQFIVYGSKNKGFENISQQWTSDTVYTKLHVKGANDATFASINQGNDFIVDDEANGIYNPINANLNIPRYLETTITNELLSEPQALLDWANKQIKLLNHPRANYTVTTLHDTAGALGDTIKVQDRTASPVISLNSRVIQKVISFASPETNQLTLGEFSAVSFRKTVASEIVNINTNVNDVKQIANNAKDTATSAQSTADDAKITSELAKKKADEANQNAQTASQKIDTIMATERSRVNGLLDQQTTKIQGVVKEASDYTDSAKAEVLNKAQSLADEAENSAIAEYNKVRDSLAQEIQDRTKAIDDANAKAQEIADKAKADAISVATTADGKINKRIDDTADSINSTISQNKLDVDGKISTVSSTANQALNGLITKVSQTDYDKKTGQLTTDLNTVTQTSNQSKQDIASIKEDNITRDSKINTITSDVNGTKQDISDIKTAYGNQDSKIASITSDVSGLNAKYTQVSSKVNGLSVGGRNLLANSDVKIVATNQNPYPIVDGMKLVNSVTMLSNKKFTLSVYINMKNVKSLNASQINRNRLLFEIYLKDISGKGYYIGTHLDNPKVGDSFEGRINTTFDATGITFTDTTLLTEGIYIQGIQANYVEVSYPKIELGTMATDWTPAPEDTDTKMATISAGIDGISGQFTDYKTSNNGTITKMQGDISTNTSAINTKVSLDTFNSTTGDLQTKYGQVNTKIDSVTTTVGDIKKKNDQQDSDIAQVKVTADSITNWVKDSNGNLSSSMMTALFNTTALKDFDKNSSVKSQTANMISSAVSDSENGMRSLISQKADSTVIGNISESLSDLQKSTQWQQIAYDDLNFLKGQGNYLITSGAGTNSPLQPWFYITVDAPRGDRITQHIWKDLDASMSYSRIFDGYNWSEWTQTVNSSTLLSIFNDQWSLGTYINTSIGQKIATGISGLPDGTLALTGRSIHLTGDTIVDGSFMTKALSTQDATIGKTLTLGSGGKFVSSGLSSAFNSYIIGMATGYGRVASPYTMGISTTGGVTIDENGYNYSATYDTWLQSTSSTWTEYKGTLNVSLTSGSLVLTENTTSVGMKGETTINAGSSKWTWSGSGIIDGYTYIDGLSLLISGASDNPKRTYITKDTIGTGGSVYGSTVSSNGLKLDTSSALVGTTSNTILLQPYQYENAGFTFRYNSSASVNTHTIQLTGKGDTLKFVNDANGSSDWSSDATVTAGKITSTSTRASKVNIEDISSDDIDKILSVNPRTFNKLQNLDAVKSDIEGTNESYTKSDLRHMLDKEYGFVIEELQEVGLSGGIFSYDEDGNAVALAYDRLTALLLGAIKRQQSEKAELELKVAKLETQVAKILEKIGD